MMEYYYLLVFEIWIQLKQKQNRNVFPFGFMKNFKHQNRMMKIAINYTFKWWWWSIQAQFEYGT